MKVYRRLVGYLKPSWKSLAGSILCTLLFTVFSGLLVLLVGPFLKTLFSPEGFVIQEQVSPADTDKISRDFLPFLSTLSDSIKRIAYDLITDETAVGSLRKLCIFIIIVALLKNLFRYLQGFLMAYVEQKLVFALRSDLYQHFHRLSLSYFHGERTGQLISRVTNDVGLVNAGVAAGFVDLIKNPMLIICYMAILIYFSWQLTLLACVVFPLVLFIIQRVGKRVRHQSRISQEKMADITSILQETISNIRVVKAFAMERFEEEKFSRKIREYLKAMLRLRRIQRLLGPVNESLITLVGVTILWFGGNQVLVQNTLEPEYFIAFFVVLFSVVQPVKTLGNTYSNIQVGMAAAKRIFHVLDTPPTLTEDPHPIPLPEFKNEIAFRDLSFQYDDSELVLEDIDLQISRNEVVALVGPSGGGKSTLMDLLARFYDPTEGSVEIDGHDLKRVKINDLRNLMGMVTQETILFNDSVRNNIAYGRTNIDDELIINAAKAAHAHEFISGLPQGYDTHIGDRGVRLSGGERQRLAIARAILKDPDVLIFDEATSALDTESEYLVQQAIENLMANRTSFVIAHRLSTIRHADRIIVLDGGRIVQQGKHDELLAQGGLYKKLYEMQFRET